MSYRGVGPPYWLPDGPDPKRRGNAWIGERVHTLMWRSGRTQTQLASVLGVDEVGCPIASEEDGMDPSADSGQRPPGSTCGSRTRCPQWSLVTGSRRLGKRQRPDHAPTRTWRLLDRRSLLNYGNPSRRRLARLPPDTSDSTSNRGGESWRFSSVTAGVSCGLAARRSEITVSERAQGARVRRRSGWSAGRRSRSSIRARLVTPEWSVSNAATYHFYLRVRVSLAASMEVPLHNLIYQTVLCRGSSGGPAGVHSHHDLAAAGRMHHRTRVTTARRWRGLRVSEIARVRGEDLVDLVGPRIH